MDRLLLLLLLIQTASESRHLQQPRESVPKVNYKFNTLSSCAIATTEVLNLYDFTCVILV